MDKFHVRLHRSVNRDRALRGGGLGTHQGDSTQMASGHGGVVLAPLCSAGAASSSEAAEAGHEGQAQFLHDLTALGVVRPLYSFPSCPRCEHPIKYEGSYKCCVCRRPIHVRCLKKGKK